MKKTLLAIAAAAALASSAETNTTVTAEAVVAEVMKVIEDEGWTAEDVADAIKSLRELYIRDNSTKEGRRRWNGAVVSTSIDTNAMTKTTVYENGSVFTDPAKVITPLDAVRAANAKLPKPVMTNGVPTRLANARLRQRENATTTNEVTVTVKAGQSL